MRGAFLLATYQLQAPSLITGDTYEEWKKETRLDIRASSGTEILGAKENAREKNCQVAKALRRSDSAKGVQHGIVARLARLTNQSLNISQVRFLTIEPRHSRARGSFFVTFVNSPMALYLVRTMPSKGSAIGLFFWD